MKNTVYLNTDIKILMQHEILCIKSTIIKFTIFLDVYIFVYVVNIIYVCIKMHCLPF